MAGPGIELQSLEIQPSALTVRSTTLHIKEPIKATHGGGGKKGGDLPVPLYPKACIVKAKMESEVPSSLLRTSGIHRFALRWHATNG